MNERNPAARRLGLVYDLAAIAIMGSIMLFTFVGIDAGLYGAAGLGAIVSFALGYRSLRAGGVTLGRGTARYAKLWLLMTVVSGLTLINGRWQPLAVFALTSSVVILLYALGGWLGARNAPTDPQR
jgi:hypothetical protein